jgi:SET domain-containing protein
MLVVKQSTIQDNGLGLFATKQIKANQIISEFIGKLFSPGNKSNTNSKNIIHFSDGYTLYSDSDCQASFANDCLMFPTGNRKLVYSLGLTESFYQKNPNAKQNATIRLNEANGQHRAYLFSLTDIQEGDEIFCHHGFQHHFEKESAYIGFRHEDYIEKNGFPANIHLFPAFDKYIKTFYPYLKKWSAKKSGDGHLIMIDCGTYTVYQMLPDYSKLFTKVAR